ncbi:MAG: arginine decarboxylase, pyruvoyl-dependent [Thermoplasmatales archaeon]|nr:arginine decarboxylase, pyruvoyl-dependent [Thermoplasmatales archaeon]
MVPRKIFFVKGVGTHRSQLGSFENALRDADIAKYNLVEVSSIFPPYAEMVDREEGLKLLKPGQILHLVLARNSSNELNRLISASVGFAIPRNRTMYGYLSEHHSFGETSEVAGKFAEELAAEMLASTIGLNSYRVDENGKFRLNDAILLTSNITASSTVKNEDEWTTVVAAAVMILE